MFIARQSDHIKADIKRNWSSWNFGEEGFEGTEEELEAELEKVEGNNSFYISGFEIWEQDKDSFEFGELYKNYWVAIDTRNKGISGIELDAETLEDAIDEAENRSDYFGDGVSFDAQKAKLVYSTDDIHIFEV